MERAMVTPPPTVVRERQESMQSSTGLGRAIRIVVVGAALIAGIACVSVLSSGGLSAANGAAGPVELDSGPTFGSTRLTPFPVHAEPSTDDLIAIMSGRGTSAVNADQGLLFAGGAGGKIVRSDPSLSGDVAAKTADGLWDAAERASKLERRTAIRHGSAKSSKKSASEHVQGKVTAGWTTADEKHRTKMLAHLDSEPGVQAALSKSSRDAEEKVAQHKHESLHSTIDGTVNTAWKTASRQAREDDVTAHKKRLKDAQDGYFKHHMSIDDALARVARIRAQHDAAQSAGAMKAKMAKIRSKEAAEEHADTEKARAEAARAKAMEAEAVQAAKSAEADEARAHYEAKKERQQLALKHADKDKTEKRAKASMANAKPVTAGWTKADAARAAYLAKKFALKPLQALKSFAGGSLHAASGAPENPQVPPAVKADKGQSMVGGVSAGHSNTATAHEQAARSQARDERRFDAVAAEISPLYPTGFIPSKVQHDDAERPDAMPEMIAGIHAKRHVEHMPVSEKMQVLERESKMKRDEQIEESVRRDERRKQEQLYKEGHSTASREREERAGEHIIDQLASNADAAGIMQKVDLSGIPVADSLKAAMSGDEKHFHAFEKERWLNECGGSQLMLGPVAKQVLDIMEQINTNNASAWLDVEDAQRRDDKAKAALRSAEAGLVSVLESQDRASAVVLLEKVRKDRAQRLAERRADKDTTADIQDSDKKMSLLLQQRQALSVLSHAEEAQALSGKSRLTS